MHGSMPRVVLMYNSGILQVANALNAQAVLLTSIMNCIYPMANGELHAA